MRFVLIAENQIINVGPVRLLGNTDMSDIMHVVLCTSFSYHIIKYIILCKDYK